MAEQPFARFPPEVLEEEIPEHRLWLKLLRELRAESQDLQALLARVRSGEIALKAYGEYVQKTLGDIADILMHVEDGDSIRHLRNLCEQILACPLLREPDKEFTAQEQLHYLTLLDTQFEQVAYQVGALTIPARVNQWLANARPGYYVPFHAVFSDEVPNRDDRQRILNHLAWSPKVINGGLVDAANGLIYRCAQSPTALVGSFVLLLLGFAVATGVVVGAGFLPIQVWPVGPQDLSTSLIGWGALLIGIIVHVGIGTAKRASEGRPPVISPGDLPLLVNAKVGQILLKLLLALVGFFGLVFAAGMENVTPLNSFLVGYSLDSVVELFTVSLEQQASAQVGTLRRYLGMGASDDGD